MAKKKKINPIIAEQRRARQEFLELKKMQSGEMPPPPKPSEIAVKPKTLGEKLKNIWYHDKYFIVGGIIGCILIVFMVAQCAKKVEPDLQIVVYTYTAVSDASCDSIADYAEKHCKDLNQDGKVKVQVINCSFSQNSSDTQYRYTVTQKMQGIIVADKNALLFITDENSISYFNGENSALEGCFKEEPKNLNAEFYEQCNENLENKDNPLNYALPEGLQLSIRNIDKSVFKKNKNLDKIVKASEEIYKVFTEE